MPRRWRDKIAVTRYLAAQVLPDLLEPVAERELTARLAQVAQDPVALRRAMVDQGVVQRTRDGAEYWRTERTEYDPDVFVPDVGRIAGDVVRPGEPAADDDVMGVHERRDPRTTGETR